MGQTEEVLSDQAARVAERSMEQDAQPTVHTFSRLRIRL